MHVLFDILLLAVFAFFVVRGWMRGFVKSVLSFGRTVLSVLLTIAFGGVFASWLSATLGGAFTAVIAYVVLFILLYAGMTVIIFLVQRIVELPILKQCNKLLGTLLGVLTGWINVSLLSTVLYAVIKVANHPEIYESSWIFKLSHNLNFFSFLIDKMI